MLKRYVKIGFRNFLKAPLFSVLNIVGLAGGMVAAVFILLWVQNELSFDAYHKKADRISRVITHLRMSKETVFNFPTVPLPLANEIKNLPEVEKVAIEYTTNDLPVKIGDQKHIIKNAAYIDSTWFEVFDYEFLYGSPKSLKSGFRNVVLTKDRAEQLFGVEDVIGKIIYLDSANYEITGVIKNIPPNSSLKSDFLIPLSTYLSKAERFQKDNNWSQFDYTTYVVLGKGYDHQKLGKKFTSIISRFRTDDKENSVNDTELELVPLKELHFNEEVGGFGQEIGNKKTVYTFLGLALVILIVACINYVNLTTARASIRSKEIGIKKLVGANSFNLFGQFMTESILTCLASLLLAVLMIYSFLPFFNSLTGKTFEVQLFSVSVLVVLIATTLLAVLLTGVYPSLLLSSFRPFEAINGKQILGSTSGRFRKMLVVVQFMVTAIFVVSAIVVHQQMKFIGEKELGYNKNNVLSFHLPMELRGKFDKQAFKSKLLSQMSIADATISTQSIVQIGSSTSGSNDWNGRPKDFVPNLYMVGVESNFQSMFGIKIKEGAWFAPHSKADINNVVLNETAVKKLNLRQPVVGQRFQFRGKEGVVIGVVKDFHYKSLREKIQPLVMYNEPEFSMGVYVKIQPHQEAKAIGAIQKIWDEQFPNLPFDYSFLDENFNNLYKSEQRTANLFNTFTIVAILISCLGLFGLTTFTAERRIKEIGIRKVLGASVSGIVVLLSQEFLLLVVIAIAIASPIGYYFMKEWLNGFEYKVNLSWPMFITTGIFIISVALITIAYQSIRAALQNPTKSLQSE